MYSRQEHLSDGTLLVVDLSIGYIRRSDIRVLLDKVKTDDWVWIPSQDAIRFPTPIPAGVLVTITRSTQMDQVINVFDKGASFTNRAMDTDFRQMLYLAQEYTEGAGIKDFYNDLNMHGFKITDLDDVEHLSTGQFRAQFPGSWRQTAMASGTSYAFDVPFPMVPKPACDRKHQGAWYTVALFYMGYNQADLKTYKLDVWLKYFAVGSDEYWVMTTSPTETGGSHFTINSIAAVNSQGLTLPLNAENPPSALRFSVTTGPTFAAGGRSGALHGGMVHNFSTHNQYAGY